MKRKISLLISCLMISGCGNQSQSSSVDTTSNSVNSEVNVTTNEADNINSEDVSESVRMSEEEAASIAESISVEESIAIEESLSLAESSSIEESLSIAESSSIEESLSIAESSSIEESLFIESSEEESRSIEESIATEESIAASIEESKAIESSIAASKVAEESSIAASIAASQAATATNIADSINKLAYVDTAYWSAKRDPKVVYITIDDGPSSNTLRILDVLDQYNAKATFFVIYKPGYEDMYREIVNRGHALAIHSKVHIYNEVYSSFDAWLYDFNFIYDYVVNITGVKPVAYRFPGGSCGSNLNAKPDVKLGALQYLNSIGMSYFDWNISNGDGGTVTADQSFSNATADIRNRKHPVMLCHDSDSKGTTVDSLPAILQQYIDWGYSFGTITPDTAPIHQGTAWDY